MDDLLAARSQMAMSLAFHILFAVAGMAMPLFMVLAEWRWLRGKDPIDLELAHRWAKGTAILFAVGAVSGTVLSFELGLLWPAFMEKAGPLIGMPFSLEGFAFFLEAIFLGIYLYGWERVPPLAHLLAGVAVAASGLLSGVFVTAVNAWMNSPVGFTLRDGALTDVEPLAAFMSPAFPTQAVHTALAAYASVAFAVLGIHAWCLLRDPESRFHQRALSLAFALAAVSVPAQIVSGDLSAKHLADHQPQKLAAAEGLFVTSRGAPLAVGGFVAGEERVLALQVPYALSILAQGDPDAEVLGLDAFPRDTWPNVFWVNLCFQLMVASGGAMLLVVLLGASVLVRKRPLAGRRWFLRCAVVASPLGLVAVEAGWCVTELGRQPWVVRGVLRTADAVTPMPGLIVPFLGFTTLYLVLGVVVVLMLRAHVFASKKP